MPPVARGEIKRRRSGAAARGTDAADELDAEELVEGIIIIDVDGCAANVRPPPSRGAILLLSCFALRA